MSQPFVSMLAGAKSAKDLSTTIALLSGSPFSSDSMYVCLLEIVKRRVHLTNNRGLREKLDALMKFLRANSKNLNTLATRVTELRKAIDYFKYAYVNEFVDLTPEEKAQRAGAQIASLKEKQENKIQFQFEDIKFIADRASKSDDWREKIAALMLSTGRRIIEVMRVTPLPKKSSVIPGHIVIEAVAKGARVGEYKLSNRVPLLFISYETMARLWKDVRDHLKPFEKLQLDDLSNLFNVSINHRISDLFKRPGTTSHTLRKIYAQAAYLQLPDKELKSHTRYMNKILMHVPKSTATEHYDTVNLLTDQKEPSPELSGPIGRKERTQANVIAKIQEAREANPLWKLTIRNLKALGIGSNTANNYIKSQREQ